MPHPDRSTVTASMTVVVPVRDRDTQLARCLEAINKSCPQSPVIVVDDSSTHVAAVHRVCAQHGAKVIRHEACAGPAAARNSGIAACSTPYVAFVDSDVVVPGSWAVSLLGHFADPCVGAVAPRVRALPPGDGVVGGYETRHSALDMGTDGGLVGPGLTTQYVPSTALVVRREAAGMGFDDALHIGEDVDLVWRLVEAGWRVRYDPSAHVWHDHRVRLGAFAARRRLYAQSIGMLARRHPHALPAANVSPSMAVPWALALAGRPRASLGAAAIQALLLSRKLQHATPRPNVLASGLIGRGLLATGLGLGHAVRRAWAPLLCVLAPRHPKLLRILLAAYATPVLQDAVTTRQPKVVAGDAVMRLLDESIALVGTWEGCARQRTVRPLLPSLSTALMSQGRPRGRGPAGRRARSGRRAPARSRTAARGAGRPPAPR